MKKFLPLLFLLFLIPSAFAIPAYQASLWVYTNDTVVVKSFQKIDVDSIPNPTFDYGDNKYIVRLVGNTSFYQTGFEIEPWKPFAYWDYNATLPYMNGTLIVAKEGLDNVIFSVDTRQLQAPAETPQKTEQPFPYEWLFAAIIIAAIAVILASFLWRRRAHPVVPSPPAYSGPQRDINFKNKKYTERPK